MIERIKILRQGGHHRTLQGHLVGRNRALTRCSGAVAHQTAYLTEWNRRRQECPMYDQGLQQDAPAPTREHKDRATFIISTWCNIRNAINCAPTLRRGVLRHWCTTHTYFINSRYFDEETGNYLCPSLSVSARQSFPYRSTRNSLLKKFKE